MQGTADRSAQDIACQQHGKSVQVQAVPTCARLRSFSRLTPSLKLLSSAQPCRSGALLGTTLVLTCTQLHDSQQHEQADMLAHSLDQSWLSKHADLTRSQILAVGAAGLPHQSTNTGATLFEGSLLTQWGMKPAAAQRPARAASCPCHPGAERADRPCCPG